MRRLVLDSADLSGDALDELKQWLAISRSDEDANLVTLLHASLDLCEGFLGQFPLIAECEELADDGHGWITLSSIPVNSVLEVDLLADDGERSPVDESDFETKISAEGIAQVRLQNPAPNARVAIRFTAGISQGWDALPGALRHGIIRLAAFHYRERDGAKTMPPPASVTALWRPWRRTRLV